MYSSDSLFSAGEFEWQVRIYYEDTDAGGVVYHAGYLRFMERARTEWLRALGFNQSRLRESGVLFAVRTLHLDYRRPARLDDELVVRSRLSDRRRASLTFLQWIVNPAQGPEPLCEGWVQVACIDAESFRPRPIPAGLATEMSRER